MTDTPRYPFSDLDQKEIKRIIRIAHAERDRVIRTFFARLFGFGVARKREAQVWPPKNAPALSLRAY